MRSHGRLFRLEDVTQLISLRNAIRETPDDPHLSVKVVDYHEGLFKVAISMLRTKPGQAGPKRAAVGTERQELASDVMQRAARRAQTSLRDLIIANRCDYMLTFTARGGMDRDQLILAVNYFFGALRAVGHDLAAVLVPELHTGEGENHGKHHGHCAVKWPGFVDFKVMQRTWNASLRRASPDHAAMDEEAVGNVDVSSRSRVSPLSLAKYLAKYLMKDFESGTAHKKRYVCYGPIRRPVKTVVCESTAVMPSMHQLLAAAMELTGSDRGYHVDSVYSSVYLTDNLQVRLQPDPDLPPPCPVPSPGMLIALAMLEPSGSGKPQDRALAGVEFERNMATFDALATQPDEPSGQFRQGDVWMEEFETLDFAWGDP